MSVGEQGRLSHASLKSVERPLCVMVDPLETEEAGAAQEPGRQRFILDDTGFDEVPKKYRRFYRKWRGPGDSRDSLAPNEGVCPVCKVVIRSTRELRPGDRVYCMPCMSRLVVFRTEAGTLEARVAYGERRSRPVCATPLGASRKGAGEERPWRRGSGSISP